MFVIASRKEAGYWSSQGWSFDLASACTFPDAGAVQKFMQLNAEVEPEMWAVERAQDFGDFNPLIDGFYTLQIGDEVFWNDPDEGLSSGYYRVTRIHSETGLVEGEHGDTIIVLCNDAGSVAEVFLSELVPSETCSIA